VPEDKPTHVDLFSGIPQGASLWPQGGQDSAPSHSAKSTGIAGKCSPKTLGLFPTPHANKHTSNCSDPANLVDSHGNLEQERNRSTKERASK
jgi:hypothetical protein